MLREGPCSQGASWVVCDFRAPPYDFLNLYGTFNTITVGFARETVEKRLHLKSFKGQTKAEELGAYSVLKYPGSYKYI
jgi:hypothetical protein